MPKVILLLSIKTTQVCEYSYGTLFRNNEILATCPLSIIFKCIFDPLTYTSSKKSFPICPCKSNVHHTKLCMEDITSYALDTITGIFAPGKSNPFKEYIARPCQLVSLYIGY